MTFGVGLNFGDGSGDSGSGAVTPAALGDDAYLERYLSEM